MNTVCKNFGAALVAAILLLATGCGTKNETPQNTKWGDLQDDSYAKLQQQFENPDMIYAPDLFWFWDEPLNREKIVSMADEILEQRFNLGYIHGRISMYELLHNTPGLGDAMEPHPSLPGDEWMSDEWLATIGQLADMAGERGAYVGYNDEYMWPSGQAKGRVVDGHPELCNEYLTFSVRDVEPGEKVALPESFFTVAARLQESADSIKYRYTHIEDNIAPAGLQAYDIKGAESLGQTLRVNEPWLNELSVMTTFYFTRTHTGFTIEVRENGPRGRLITSKYFPGGRYEDDKPTLPIPEVLPAGTVVYVGLIPDDTSIDGDMAWWYKSGNLYKDGCAYIDGKPANFKQLPGRLDEELKLPGTRLKSHIRFVSGEFDMLQKHRIIDNRHFFWVANNGDETQIPELEIQGIHGKVTKWDCETGKIEDVPSLTIGMNERIRIAFQPNEAFWIVVDPSQPSDGHLEKYCDEAVLQTIAGIWNITIPETVQPVLENPVEYPDSILPKPLSDWNRWSELPSGFSGLLDYSTHFVIDAPVDSAIIDLGTVYHFAQVWVNGKDCGAKLWAPYKFSTDNLKQGENHIVIRVGNLVNNNYDMEYERKLLGRYLPPETFRSGLMGPVRILSEQ